MATDVEIPTSKKRENVIDMSGLVIAVDGIMIDGVLIDDAGGIPQLPDGGVVDLSDYYTKGEVDTKVAEAASGGTIDLSNYYTKTSTYSKTEVDTALNGKVSTAALTTALAAKADASALSAKADATAVATSLATKANLTTVEDLQAQVDALQALVDELINNQETPPTLGTLSLSVTTVDEDAVWTATISGKTVGSVITATSSDGTTLTVTGGTTVSGTFADPGAPTVSLIETLGGATGSPKTTNISITVNTVIPDTTPGSSVAFPGVPFLVPGSTLAPNLAGGVPGTSTNERNGKPLTHDYIVGVKPTGITDRNMTVAEAQSQLLNVSTGTLPPGASRSGQNIWIDNISNKSYSGWYVPPGWQIICPWNATGLVFTNIFIHQGKFSPQQSQVKLKTFTLLWERADNPTTTVDDNIANGGFLTLEDGCVWHSPYDFLKGGGLVSMTDVFVYGVGRGGPSAHGDCVQFLPTDGRTVTVQRVYFNMATSGYGETSWFRSDGGYNSVLTVTNSVFVGDNVNAWALGPEGKGGTAEVTNCAFMKEKDDSGNQYNGPLLYNDGTVNVAVGKGNYFHDNIALTRDSTTSSGYKANGAFAETATP